MPIILTLFFLSLSGIIYMIGNKLIVLQKEGLEVGEHVKINTPDLQDIKVIVVKNTKKYSFILLVLTLRFSVKSTHFIKTKSKEIKEKIIIKIKKITTSKKHGTPEQQKEISGFLKTISDYKKKVKRIKHKIKEEEGIV